MTQANKHWCSDIISASITVVTVENSQCISVNNDITISYLLMLLFFFIVIGTYFLDDRRIKHEVLQLDLNVGAIITSISAPAAMEVHGLHTLPSS